MRKLALVMVLALFSAGAAVAAEKGGMPGGGTLTFTTGGAQGTYYGFGGVLAGKVGETTSTTVTAITSGGSQANVEAMDAGDAQLSEEAGRGEGGDDGEPDEDGDAGRPGQGGAGQERLQAHGKAEERPS